jgi:hypothetical protein
VFVLIICRAYVLPALLLLLLLQNLNFPLLENKNEWHIHGYAYGNYLAELSPPGQVFAKGASLDKAFEGVGGGAAVYRMYTARIERDACQCSLCSTDLLACLRQHMALNSPACSDSRSACACLQGLACIY